MTAPASANSARTKKDSRARESRLRRCNFRPSRGCRKSAAQIYCARSSGSRRCEHRMTEQRLKKRKRPAGRGRGAWGRQECVRCAVFSLFTGGTAESAARTSSLNRKAGRNRHSCCTRVLHRMRRRKAIRFHSCGTTLDYLRVHQRRPRDGRCSGPEYRCSSFSALDRMTLRPRSLVRPRSPVRHSTGLLQDNQAPGSSRGCRSSDIHRRCPSRGFMRCDLRASHD